MKKRFERNNFGDHLANVETAAKMIDPQIIAKVKNYFLRGAPVNKGKINARMLQKITVLACCEMAKEDNHFSRSSKEYSCASDLLNTRLPAGRLNRIFWIKALIDRLD